MDQLESTSAKIQYYETHKARYPCATHPRFHLAGAWFYRFDDAKKENCARIYDAVLRELADNKVSLCADDEDLANIVGVVGYEGASRWGAAVRLYESIDAQHRPNDEFFYLCAMHSYRQKKRYGAALEIHEKNAWTQPNVEQLFRLSGAYLGVGEASKAMALAKRENDIAQPWIATHDPKLSLREIRLHHEAVAARRYPVVAKVHPRPSAKDADRPLRVGFVTGDYGCTVVFPFARSAIDPALHKGFELFLYNTQVVDECTQTFDKHGTRRDVAGVPDDRLAQMIAADKIDVAIDLAGCTNHSGLGALARKPAPLQITGIGYPDTTGLAAVDCRFADWVSDQKNDDNYTERLLRFDRGRSFLCYTPESSEYALPVPPLAQRDFAVLGLFNNPRKLSDPLLTDVLRMMEALPKSRLALKYNSDWRDPANQRRFLARFSGLNKAVGLRDLASRVDFHGRLPTEYAHRTFMAQTADVAVDTYPVCGTYTTIECLWMGLPVVTRTVPGLHAANVSNSILTHIDLSQWVTHDSKAFVDTVVKLARDRQQLQHWRTGMTLRRELLSSPLCDRAGYAENFWRLVRQAWRDLCSPGQR